MRLALVSLLLLGGIACDSGTPGTALDGGQGEGLRALEGGAAELGGQEQGAMDAGLGEFGRDFEPELGLADSAPSCTPLPFTPPGSPAGFEHTTTKLLVVSQGPANHRGQDVVALEGAPQVLIAKFAYGPFDKDLIDEEVEVFIDKTPPCGPWVSLGKVRTSNNGDNGTTYGILDDGGRIFFTLAEADRLPAGRYPVRMLALGDHSVAAFTLFVVKPNTSTVVFDIDGTLTTDDAQLFAELFTQLLGGSYVPVAHQGAAAVVSAWVAKGYLPVYLTGRPDWLHTTSQAWLEAGDFPPGVLHLTDTNAQALPANTADYKAAFLGLLKDPSQLQLAAAYGNADTDIAAYERVAIAKDSTFIVGSLAGQQGTVALPNYSDHLSVVQALPKASVAAPVDTFGW